MRLLNKLHRSPGAGGMRLVCCVNGVDIILKIRMQAALDGVPRILRNVIFQPVLIAPFPTSPTALAILAHGQEPAFARAIQNLWSRHSLRPYEHRHGSTPSRIVLRDSIPNLLLFFLERVLLPSIGSPPERLSIGNVGQSLPSLCRPA